MIRAQSAIIAIAVAVPAIAWAQFQPIPAPPYYAISPAAPLNPRADSPAQQQVIQNYRTQLQQTQRDLFQQNASGLSRDQLEIGRQLNAVGPGAIMPPSAAITPSGGIPSGAAPNVVPYR